jgi:hypothetical protein
MIKKIVSGGQTGADLAGLDVAIKLNMPHGGWLPKGRLTEDGPLDDKYQLQEMETDSFPKRTTQNVLDSDGTLILSHGKLSGGSELTVRMAKKHNKPWLHVELGKKSMLYTARLVQSWLIDNGISVLNVAGPRASNDPKIYEAVQGLLEKIFAGGST